MKFTRWSNTARTGWWSLACVTSLSISNSYAQGRPAVALDLDGTWPDQLAIEVRKDLGASLRERGVLVLADGDPTAGATLRISPPSQGVPQVQVQVVNPNRDVAAARELSLAREHPDTWSVAIAATADELLAATWSLPAPIPPPPPSPARPLPAPPTRVPEAPDTPYGELGLGVALEQYLPNAQLYGGDVFFGMALGERLQLELGAWFRDIVPQDSGSGEVYGTVVGGDVVLNVNLIRGRWLGVDGLTGVHGGIAWFDGRADEGVEARSVSGALLSARVGGRASLFTTERTRLSLTAMAGIPVVTAAARDTGRDVIALRGADVSARLEVGWKF